jgi:general secretion pathway protein A
MYAEHFGFSDVPFSVTPDPRFFYANPLYHEAFASLRYGIESRKGFVVITGEVGTGKTTLLKIFMHSVESTIHTAFIFNPKLSFTELLRFILNDLGISNSAGDRLTLMERLNDYLIEQLDKGHIVALLVDEAQDLSDEVLEELRLLSNFETDKDKLIQIVLMGQPELDERLDQPGLRQLKQRVAIRCRLAPLGRHEIIPYINHRLKTVGYAGKELFDRDAVERITLYSKGIPRLINVICDNALLIAYAASKRKVSAEMVEEVARDLQLGAPRPIKVASPMDFKIPESQVEPRVKEQRLPEFDEFFVGEEEQRRPELQQKRSLKGLGNAILLGAVLLGGIGTVSYSSQSQNYLSDLAVRLEAFSHRGKDYLSGLTVKAKDFSQRTEEYLADSAVKAEDLSIQGTNYILRLGAKAGDLSRKGGDYLSGLAARMGEFASSQWQSLKQVKPIPKTSDDNRSNLRLADSSDVGPTKWTEPSGNPAPAAETPPAISQELEKPKPSKNVAPLPVAKKPAEPQTPKGSVTRAEKQPTTARTADNSKAQPVQPQLATLKNEPTQLDRQKPAMKEQPRNLGNFEVVEDSFVRDKPQTNAEIVTTLRPGTWVRVENKSGEYFRVRSLNDPGIQGYVHEEDAFFARIK